MANVTINLTLPSFRVSAAMHQRIVALVALLTAGSEAISAYGPGFGLPAAEGIYLGSGIIVVATLLRAIFPAPDPVVTPAA